MISMLLSAVSGAGMGFFLYHAGIYLDNWHFWAIYGSASIFYISGVLNET